MLAGAAALAGIPLTSGFFSKDAILFSALTLPHGNVILYAVGLLTAFLTAIYSFRMIYLTFYGAPRKEFHVHLPDAPQLIPLFVLAFFALFAGFLNIPGIASWEHFINPNFGEGLAEGHSINGELIAAVVSGVLALAGWLIARSIYSPKRVDAGNFSPALAMAPSTVEIESPAPYRSSAVNFLYRAWDFDQLYHVLWVVPYRLLSEALAWVDEHIIDGIYEAVAVIFQLFHGFFVTLQNGRIGRYAGFMLFGAVAVSIIILLFVPGIL
jgi:NADH-quinone oxidoreductase subunit L